MRGDGPSARAYLIGVGSAQGADALGWLVADGVAALNRPWLKVRKVASPIDLLEFVSPELPLALVDATEAPLPASALWRFRWPELPCESWQALSSHAFDLRYVLQLAGSLQLLPQTVLIYAVDATRVRVPESDERYHSSQTVPLDLVVRWVVDDYERTVAQKASISSGPVAAATERRDVGH